MASTSEVVKKVTRFKLQLADTAESATVLKILQKLKDLDITLDILAETGIGKTVNSFRRHEQAGEFAKSLVRGWKRLVPKESMSHTEDGDVSQSLSIKDKLDNQNCPNNESLDMEDLNNNFSTSHDKSSSDEALLKGHRTADSEKQCEEQRGREDQHKNQEKSQQEKQNMFQNDGLKRKLGIQEDKMDNSVVSKKKKIDTRKSGYGDSEDTPQKSRSDSRERLKSSSDGGTFGSEKESNEKLKTSKDWSKEGKESFSFGSSDKYSKTLKLAKEEASSGIQRSSEAQNKKRKKKGKDATLEYKKESKNKGNSNEKEKERHPAGPSMSFESYLNYDMNVRKRKERSGFNKPPKKIKTVKETTKDPDMKTFKTLMSANITSPKQKFKESLMDLMNIPLPAALPECEKLSSVEYFERKVEKECDSCDASEESTVFTGQRLNRKMQVYSGAKTIFLPTMMSLHQQCIRTLQNNINLLYETGGVPFEILEPVLERCTPEQLLRIEECNPIYIGVTDHLWGKHCQRDFKHSKLQEYESWKEMYIRLSEERERKLQRLTKSIVSAHSRKPKGRQVKMAFIHTVAKPPRDVRIQQEIHGTAVQQPHQLRCRSRMFEA
ncbi:hypothetical protein L3Q82_001743 [Scortum barcoo]|uniref:Uncharacterized protein n=1 Tax=Scortum barcoo TaxID=214431 RepID=A0ACB8W4K2_9TELE|nr:hypothetical protein L3Q82_001743 [Scortum barcoo]